ncbi:hypothetical protein ACOCG7_24835 [Paraburkholderia sp. DD10]|uniref:hypothetical protein n=1 Tax=Paraburkholderia TaxID=1822464 RepID=UPI003A06606E
MSSFYRNVKYPLWTKSAYSLDCRECFQRKAREARARNPEKSRDANRRGYVKRKSLASDTYCLQNFRMSAADVAKHREGQKTRAEESRRRNLNIRAFRASAPRREGPTWVERKIQDWYRKKVKRSVARLVDRHDSDDVPPSRDYQADLLRDESLSPMERLMKLREFNQRRKDE